MNLLRSRLPSRQDLWLVFSASAFLIHSWALLNYLREVPGYLNRLTIGEMLGILSYVLVLALLETAGAVLFVTILAFLTPRRFLLDRFVPQGLILIYVPGLWAIPIHYQTRLFSLVEITPQVYLAGFAIWLSTFLLALVDLSLVFRRHPRIEHGLRSFADQLTVLAWVYLAIDLTAVINLVIRNL